MGTTRPEISLRPVVAAEEREDCARLMSATEPWTTLGRTFEQSLALVSDRSRELYLVRCGEEWAGFLLLSMQGPFPGYIQTICLRPEWRGRGLGTEIIAWAESRILRESPNVFMCVSDFNADAFRLYQRLGYQVVGRLEDYLVRGSAEILLRKTTGSWTDFRPER